MADHGVQRDDVEVVIAVRRVVRVADLVGDPVRQTLVRGQPSGGVDQRRAVVEPDDGRARADQARERAHLDAGAASEGEDASGVGERQTREVRLRQPDVALVGPAKLQPGGDRLQHLGVHARSEAEDVAVVADGRCRPSGWAVVGWSRTGGHVRSSHSGQRPRARSRVARALRLSSAGAAGGDERLEHEPGCRREPPELHRHALVVTVRPVLDDLAVANRSQWVCVAANCRPVGGIACSTRPSSP